MEKPDREKYIGILSRAAKVVKEFSEDTPIIFGLEFVEDILDLLKEQEPKEAIWDCPTCGWPLSGACDQIEAENVHFCPHCGQAVEAHI